METPLGNRPRSQHQVSRVGCVDFLALASWSLWKGPWGRGTHPVPLEVATWGFPLGLPGYTRLVEPHSL